MGAESGLIGPRPARTAPRETSDCSPDASALNLNYRQCKSCHKCSMVKPPAPRSRESKTRLQARVQVRGGLRSGAGSPHHGRTGNILDYVNYLPDTARM